MAVVDIGELMTIWFFEDEVEIFSATERCRFELCGNQPYRCIDTSIGRVPICKTHHELIHDDGMDFYVYKEE